MCEKFLQKYYVFIEKKRWNIEEKKKEKRKRSNTSSLRERNPVTTSAMFVKVILQSGIFFRRPRSSFNICFVTTRCSTHFIKTNKQGLKKGGGKTERKQRNFWEIEREEVRESIRKSTPIMLRTWKLR